MDRVCISLQFHIGHLAQDVSYPVAKSVSYIFLSLAPVVILAQCRGLASSEKASSNSTCFSQFPKTQKENFNEDETFDCVTCDCRYAIRRLRERWVGPECKPRRRDQRHHTHFQYCQSSRRWQAGPHQHPN